MNLLLQDSQTITLSIRDMIDVLFDALEIIYTVEFDLPEDSEFYTKFGMFWHHSRLLDQVKYAARKYSVLGIIIDIVIFYECSAYRTSQ